MLALTASIIRGHTSLVHSIIISLAPADCSKNATVYAFAGKYQHEVAMYRVRVDVVQTRLDYRFRFTWQRINIIYPYLC